MNKVNSEAWLAWVLTKIQEHPVNRMDELLPWAYQAIMDKEKDA
jgi:transposase